MRVMMMTQVLDRHDQVLSFTHDWVEALAARVEHLVVVPVSAGHYSVPDNVTVASMGKERGAGRLGRASGFYSTLNQYVQQIDVLFAHMSPRYVLAAAPLAALYRKPITLWYTHRQASSELQLAVPLAQHIATAHATSFPIESPKVRPLGHGINTDVFTPDDTPPSEPPLIVSLARLSPIKRHESLIRAAALLRDQYDDPPARFVIAGGTLPGQTEDYARFLQSEIDRLRVGDRVTMWGAIPSEAVPGVFNEASLAFNGSPPGLFDKAALESMLCGVPTVVANDAFADVMGESTDQLCIPDGGDEAALAEKLHALLSLSPESRRELGMTLSERTATAHSLDQLMDRLVALMAS